MKDRLRVVAVALAVCVSCIATSHAAVKPVVTNKLRFRIPFRFDPEALRRMNARELQLFVSPNRGASWELAQAIPPQSGKFEYHAPADGEFWFAVRTVDGTGLAHPPGPRFEAGLIVVVDSIQPTLALGLDQTAPGKIQLTWSASDANLDAKTLRLEYQQPGQQGWQPVSVVPTQRGMTSWTIPAAGRVSVRGSVADLAGNVGEARADVDAAGGGRGQPAPTTPDLRQPIAVEPGSDQFSEQAIPPIGIHPGLASNPAATQDQLVADQPEQRPTVVQDRWPAPQPAPEAGGYRVGARQRIVNTRRFQLGYKLDDVGPSGVGGVELFITPDHGRQWYRYGEDADRASPFEVEVPRDGEYGFSIRVRSGAGLGLEPPGPGEPPSIQVIVDQTPPRLELLPIEQGRGMNLNQITIRWRLAEDRPADKPVSLYYSPSPQGPWEPISGWRQDTGSFTWSVGLGAPARLYIRVMARDAAGNVAQADSMQPIVVDLARPTARIVDVDVAPTDRPR